MKLIDKDKLEAEIKKRFDEYTSSIFKHYDAYKEAKAQELGKILTILDTLEVEVVAEQDGTCNGIFNRIIANNCNLLIPLDKMGLKHGDKVKIFITK